MRVFDDGDKVEITYPGSIYYGQRGYIESYDPTSWEEYTVRMYYDNNVVRFTDRSMKYIGGPKMPPTPNFMNKYVEKSSNFNNKRCFHEWKSTRLIYTEVWDCKHCGIKKEDADKPVEDDCPF